jgi:hypothetical protein
MLSGNIMYICSMNACLLIQIVNVYSTGRLYRPTVQFILSGSECLCKLGTCVKWLMTEVFLHYVMSRFYYIILCRPMLLYDAALM